MTENTLLPENIHVVLVEPGNAGNIGSVVRAMKNMGVKHLRLVNPVPYRDDVEQRKLGYRAQEIIAASVEFSSLKDALADISLAFVATSKDGKWKQDFIFPEKAADIISEASPEEKIAVVFGREDSGVTIDECQMANYNIIVPTAVSYPSLNLSQAVLIILYEIYRKVRNPRQPLQERRADQAEYERIYDNIWSLMKGLEFREEEKGLFHRSLKRALNRTAWTSSDIAVFDRVCKQVRWFIQNHGNTDYHDDYDPNKK